MDTVLRPILKQGIGFLSRRRSNGRLLVLTYHRVLADFDPVIGEIDAVQFTQQMEALAEYFNVISLNDAIEQLKFGELEPGSVCITFDDGYRDNYDVALPILSALNLPATFFIATGFLGNGVMWNDVVIESLRNTKLDVIDLQQFGLGKQAIHTTDLRYQLVGKVLQRFKYEERSVRDELVQSFKQVAEVDIDDRMMMTKDEVLEMSSANMEIGAHTVNHPILARIDDEQAKQEITSSKQELEQIIGKDVRFFAYPNGQANRDYTQRDQDLIREAGFLASLTTNDGVITTHSNLYELPRISVNHTEKFKFGVSLARGYVQYAS